MPRFNGNNRGSCFAQRLRQDKPAFNELRRDIPATGNRRNSHKRTQKAQKHTFPSQHLGTSASQKLYSIPNS